MDDFGYKLLDIADLNRISQRSVLWLVEFAFFQKNCNPEEGLSISIGHPDTRELTICWKP
jgi:hypothetical protein